MICRYTLVERAIHWLAALTYAYVLLTGLAFYSRTSTGSPPCWAERLRRASGIPGSR
jgi:cytochrome b subunit of formate dehydrogenase